MRHMVILGDRRERAVVVIAAVCALVITAWFAMGQTRATFSDTTENPNNAFSTGSVSLTDDRNGSAMFQVSDLLPGMSVQETITVINQSPTGMNVKLYADEFVETPDSFTGRGSTGLAENLDLLVELVETDDTGLVVSTVFNGTMASFAQFAEVTDTEPWNYGHSVTGVGDPLAPNGDAGSTTQYRFTVTLRASAGAPQENVQPGDSVRVTFVWEGRA